jgi:hypothetical protein
MDDYPKRPDHIELTTPQVSERDTTTATLDPAFTNQEAAEAGVPAGHELQAKQPLEEASVNGDHAALVEKTPEYPFEEPQQGSETDHPGAKTRTARASGELAITKAVKPKEETQTAIQGNQQPAPEPIHIEDRDPSSDPPEAEDTARDPGQDTSGSDEPAPRSSNDGIKPPPPPDTPDAANEHPEDPEETKAAIRARCLEDVDQELAHIQRLNEDDDFIDISGGIASILGDQAIASAKAGDIAAADTKIDLLADLDGMTEEKLASACFLVNSRHSKAVLSERLAEEKTIATSYKMAAEEEDATTPYDGTAALLALSDSPMLSQAIVASESEESPGPPDDLINEFGTDDAHKLYLYITHGVRAHQVAPEEKKPEWESYVDEKVAEFTTNEELTTAQIRSYTGSLIERLPTTDLRQKVLDRYLAKHAASPLTMGTFDEHMRIVNAVFEDPGLITSTNVDALQGSMNSYTGALRTPEGRYHVALGQIDWDVTMLDYRDIPPEDVVRDAESKKQYLFMTAFGAGKEMLTERQNIDMKIDAAYNTQAVRRASWGDYASAGSYIASIHNESISRATLQTCIHRAESQADIDAIKPYEAALANNPRLELHVRVAEALVSQNVEHILYTANEIADNIDLQNKGEWTGLSTNLTTIFNRVAEDYPDRKEELARQILTTLRGKEGYTAFHTFPYSEVLIRAGDAEEMERAYQDASQRYSNISPRISNLWRLAQLLKEEV